MADIVNTRRRYHSPDRRARATATTQEITRAAERLFEAHGYAAVTMKQIATAAAVAPATLYLHFESKPAIVAALARTITDATDLSVELVEQSDGVQQAIRTGARILRQLNERSWLVGEILRSHSATDSALTSLAKEWNSMHLDAVRRGVAAIAEAANLRPGLGVARAVDVMYAVGGTEVFRSLTKDRGWTPAEYEGWLTQWAARELLDPE